MKRLFALALIPLVSGCQLLSDAINPGDSNLELQVASTIPTFQYLIPGDTSWQSVPSVSLTGELTVKDALGTVLGAGAINPSGVSSLKTKPGGQTLFGVLRSNQVIAEARQEITPGQGASKVSLTFHAIISRVVFPPISDTVKAGSTVNLPFWVFGPLYRVAGVGAFTANASVSGSGELVAGDSQTVQIRVNSEAAPGSKVNVFLTVRSNNPQSPTQASTSLVLTVGQ